MYSLVLSRMLYERSFNEKHMELPIKLRYSLSNNVYKCEGLIQLRSVGINCVSFTFSMN